MARQHSDTARRRRPRPTSPMAVDIMRLGRRPGSMVTLRDTVPSPSRIGRGADRDRAGCPAGAGSAGGVGVGRRAGDRDGGRAHRRRVRPLPDPGRRAACKWRLTELFAYPDSTTEATTEEDEVGRVVDDTIDLEQPIIDAVGLELPFSPVCQPDCPGLCPECGVQLAAEPGHHHDPIDPRWAKLAAMLLAGRPRRNPRGEQ